MTDSHLHLTSNEFEGEIEKVLKEFKNNKGLYLLNCSTTVEDSIKLISLKPFYDSIAPKTVLIALGLHPENYVEDSPDFNNSYNKSITFEKTRKNIERLEQIISENIHLITAIGETGMDYFWIYKTAKDISKKIARIEEQIEMQRLSFSRHLEIALKYDLPLSIHSRDSQENTDCTQNTLKTISEIGKGRIKGSFHSFTGSIEHLNDIIDLGFMIGFNPIITYKNAQSVRDLVKACPLEKMLLETDAPLLPLRKPYVSSQTQYGSPTDVKVVAQVIAEIKGITTEDVIYQTDRNFEEVFATKISKS